MILLSRLLSSTTRISSKISTSFDVNLIMNWTFMSSILLSNSSIPFSMSTCSTLEVYYLKVTRKYLPYSDGSFASSVFESFISFFKALYFLNSWPSCKFFKNVWTVLFWIHQNFPTSLLLNPWRQRSTHCILLHWWMLLQDFCTSQIYHLPSVTVRKSW